MRDSGRNCLYFYPDAYLDEAQKRGIADKTEELRKGKRFMTFFCLVIFVVLIADIAGWNGVKDFMAFNQTERNAAKATQSLFTKVGAWGARWGSNGFEEITNYYSQVTCSYAVIKGIRVGALKSVLYDGVYSIFSTMKTKIDNLPR